jgi:lipopolysaccharide/colanic/teichoic acid biosynthesis glycosyltransferase
MPFFPQEFFITLLCLERKRSARSGEPFALALLDVTRLSDPSSLGEALVAKLRSTDIPGWYNGPDEMGVIFTNLNGAPIDRLRPRLLEQIDKCITSALPREQRKMVGVTLFIFPEDSGEELYPDLFALGQGSGFHKRSFMYHVSKRVMDIVGSAAALTVLSPVFLVIAAFVKLSSEGPVLYRQKRLGLLGKQFDCLKFRTMYVNNDPTIHREYVAGLIDGHRSESGVYKIQNDPRVTGVGRFLRKWSLDELPQFLNVLRGQMSLVGPRPPIPYEKEVYRIWHMQRMEVKPGLTGLWQVMGRSRTNFAEMVRLDLRYMQNQSTLLDLKILLRTPRAVLTGKGAY